MNHKLSFVIASRNEEPEVINATIHGLLATSFGYWREIIVVDDASDPPISFPHPEVVILRNATQVGSGLSRRRGSSAACGDVIIGMDAHMSFAPGWLQEMLKYVDTKALLCPPWRNFDHTTTYHWGCNFGWNSIRDYSRALHPGIMYRGLYKPDNNEPLIDIPMVIGACYVMRRDAYEEIGGWNPHYAIYGSEEQDISARAWLMGAGVKCVTRARVGHLDRSEKYKTPFEIKWDFFEHNQMVMIQTLFEKETSALLSDYMAPVPPRVLEELEKRDLRGWRAFVQSRRKMDDATFFKRFFPEAPVVFGRKGVRLKPGEMPPGIIHRAAAIEEKQLWKERRKVPAPIARKRKILAPPLTPSPRILRQAPPPAVQHPDLATPQWNTSFAIRVLGMAIGFRTEKPEAVRYIVKGLPEGWEPCPVTDVDLLYSLTIHKDHFRLYAGAGFVGELENLDALPDLLAASLRYELVENAPDRVFINAAVVGWKGRAIVVLGDRWSGRPALLVQLLRSGATYLSHSFAVLDSEGMIYPFAQALEFRQGRGEPPRQWPTRRLRCHTTPLPLGGIVASTLRPGAKWKPTELSRSKAFLRLFGNAVNARRLGKHAFFILQSAVSNVVALEGHRDDLPSAARAILKKTEGKHANRPQASEARR